MGKRFVYGEVEYNKYPSPIELNEEGLEGNELVCIHKVKKQFFDNVLEKYYEQEIYKATFKREI